MFTLKISDMSCGHCVRTIDAAVRTVDGRASIAADLDAHLVEVRSDADEAALRRAIAEAGYENEKIPA